MKFSPLLLGLILAMPLAAQLEPDSNPVSLGPSGGSGAAVAVHPSDPDEVLVIRYTQGIFRSTDGGDTFGEDPYGTGVSGEVRALVQDLNDADTLYTLDGNQVFKSTDFGASWSPLSLLGLYSNLNSLAVAPTGDDLLATDAFNAYHSADGGATWTTVLQVVPFSGDVLGTVIYSQSDASVAYIAYSDGLFRSDDGGQTFADTGPFTIKVKGLVTSASDPMKVFATTAFDGLFVSTDGGATMTSVLVDFGSSGNWMAAEPGGGLWHAALQAMHYSSDDGATWTQVNQGLNDLTPIPASFAVGPDGRRFLGADTNSIYGDQTGGGLYRMPAGAPSSWDHIGFLASPIPDVAIAEPGGLRVVGFGLGVNAAPQGGDLQLTDVYLHRIDSIAIDPDDPTRWLAGGAGWGNQATQVRVLTGDGADHVLTYERYGAGWIEDIEYDPFDSDRVLAGIYPGVGGEEGILRSTFSGATWIEVDGTEGWGVRDITFDPFSQGRVLALLQDNWWAGSLDGGVTWGPITPGWPGSGEAVFLQYDLFNPDVVWRGDDGDGLWRSDDGGATWTSLGIPLDFDSGFLQHPQFPGLLWVGNANGEILVSADGGGSFQLALDVPLGAIGSAMAMDTADGSMLIGTNGSSAWELPNASPAVKLGDGSAGSGGFTPRLYIGKLPQIGNPAFVLNGDHFRGSAPVVLVFSAFATSVPAFGGTFFVGSPFNLIPFNGGGPAGVPGAGSFSLQGALPNDPQLAGVSIYIQYGVDDPVAPTFENIVLSDGLQLTFHN